jgi:hypothetical protein
MMEITLSFQYNLKQQTGHFSDDYFLPAGWMELGRNVPISIAQKFTDDIDVGTLRIENSYQAILAWHDYIFPYLIKDIK